MSDNKEKEVSKIIKVVKKDGFEFEENDKFEKIINKMIHIPLTIKPSNIKNKITNNSILPLPSIQQEELFKISVEKEINGIGMGVLENGIPYLTGAGLVRMCGIDDKTLREFANNWETEQNKPRGKKIKEMLEVSNYNDKHLFIPIAINNQIYHAYPESVCLAFLEYYAFHSKPHKEKARENLILLARKTFRDFIYTSVQYNPDTKTLNQWKYFLDRVDLNLDTVPMGYFSVFREQAGFTATLIRSKVIVNDKTIPDISVGSCWSKHWIENNFDTKYGSRQKYEHNYPDYYPQSASNPQEPWCYPNEALGEFRKWFYAEYVANKFPKYLSDKVKQNVLSNNDKQNLLNAIKPKQIT